MKIVIQQSIIPDYRIGLFLLLREHWGDQLRIYAGDADFGGSPVSTPRAWDKFIRVRNLYLARDRFLWQQDCFFHLLNADVAILNGNMRILSNNLILLLRKLLGRRTVLWGHAEGQSDIGAAIRGLYLRFSDGFIAYTETQAKMLRSRYPSVQVWVAPNSCVAACDCVPVCATAHELTTILYVGRLVEEKKAQLLLEGFIQARNNNLIPPHLRLVFVGDGVERVDLQIRAEAAGVDQLVEFAGHVSDISKLKEYYRSAICTVSPGYVGLSATQSFSFGIPMLIARDEFHSPEIEACKEDFNAVFFVSDNTQSLSQGLCEFWRNRISWYERRDEISAWTRQHYSFESMRDSFVKVIDF